MLTTFFFSLRQPLQELHCFSARSNRRLASQKASCRRLDLGPARGK